ncbi:MAG TPA: pyridoxamine 5'-phosphate oxidase family protein [Streptosporangiaceae bacterium]|jgi:nitroimidazol reductase NimA-like FMN-containing flavoprotein (pyridoxamine 5'-phosphate oxidase superfamily)
MADLTKSYLQSLSEAECWELISAGGIGRIGYSGRYGPMIQPVNYKVFEKTVVFRTAEHSTMGEDLRTGIAHAEYRVAFEIDAYYLDEHAGWSVLIQGDAHYVDSEEELAAVSQVGVEAWVAGERNLFLRIIPAHIGGRRVGRPA